MKKVKTICFWCGKSHKKSPPKKCKDSSILMSAVCKKMPAWQVMRALEMMGRAGLDALAIELGLYRLVK